MKRNFKSKDIYTTKTKNTTPYTAKHILNTLYGKMHKEDIMNYREECLRMANEIVNGARENDYGTPEDNFHAIAELWSSYLFSPIDKRDVANMMILLKIARTKTGTATDDCFVDMAGYAACAYEMNQAKHPIDPTEYVEYEKGKEIKFDDCSWGNPEYGDIKMFEEGCIFESDDPANILFDTDGNAYFVKQPEKPDEDTEWRAETFMKKGYFPNKPEEPHHPDTLTEKHACYDAFSGLYFKSNILEITQIIEKMNATIYEAGFVNIRTFYDELGLDPQMSTVGIGWCEELNDHVVVSYFSRLEPDGSPCLIINLEPIKYIDHMYGVNHE